MDRTGWFGAASDVLEFLNEQKADQDDEGAFKIAGKPVCVGIGGDEIVIPNETVYFIDGKAIPLAENMPKESSGLMVKVF